jgi:hypothetical protein
MLDLSNAVRHAHDRAREPTSQARPRAPRQTSPLLVALMGAGLAGRYPFLDPWTSQFFLVLVMVVATVGLGAFAGLLTRSHRTVLLGAALLLICGVSFVPASVRATPRLHPGRERSRPDPARTLGPRFDDVVLVTSGAQTRSAVTGRRPRHSLTGRPSARSPSRSTTRNSLISWSPPAATARAISRRCRVYQRAPCGYGSWWVTSAWETWARLAERFGHPQQGCLRGR